MTPADTHASPTARPGPATERPVLYRAAAVLSRVAAFLVLPVFALTLSSCATFSDDPRVRTPGSMLDDEALEKVVEREIRKSDAELKKAHLVIVSYGGIVLLIGQVSTEELKNQAQTVTQGIAKVRKVHNEIGVGGPISYVARSNDGWLTTKVKGKLIAADNVPGRKVKVQTENGVVYLMGFLTRAEADAAVQAAATVFGVQQIVRVFEYLD